MKINIERRSGDRNHEYYNRWMGIIQRCCSLNLIVAKDYSARQIEVDYIWSNTNPYGFNNFVRWMDLEFKKESILNPEFNKINYKVARKDINKNFSPINCHIATGIEVSQNRIDSVLDFDTVVKMRKYKKLHKDITLAQMSEIFDQGIVNISRSLRGISWANVNDTEAPIESFKDN